MRTYRTDVCSQRSRVSSPRAAQRDTASEGPWFVDVASETGLAFTHHSDRTDEFYYPEVIGSGRCALRQRQRWRPRCVSRSGAASRVSTPAEAKELRSRLFRNDLVSGADGRAAPVRRRHGPERSVAERQWNGRGGRRLRQRRLRGLYTSRASSGNWLMRNDCRGGVHRRVRAERNAGQRVERVGGVRRFRPRRLARSLRRPLPHVESRR